MRWLRVSANTSTARAPWRRNSVRRPQTTPWHSRRRFAAGDLHLAQGWYCASTWGCGGSWPICSNQRVNSIASSAPAWCPANGKVGRVHRIAHQHHVAAPLSATTARSAPRWKFSHAEPRKCRALVMSGWPCPNSWQTAARKTPPTGLISPVQPMRLATRSQGTRR